MNSISSNNLKGYLAFTTSYKLKFFILWPTNSFVSNAKKATAANLHIFNIQVCVFRLPGAMVQYLLIRKTIGILSIR